MLVHWATESASRRPNLPSSSTTPKSMIPPKNILANVTTMFDSPSVIAFLAITASTAHNIVAMMIRMSPSDGFDQRVPGLPVRNIP